jgi:hypothetical protein
MKLMYALFLFVPFFLRTSSDPNPLIIDRIGVSNAYYSDVKLLKKDLPPFRKDILDVLPDTIDYYNFKIGDDQRKEIGTCTNYINEMKKAFQGECNKIGKRYTDADFGKYWITRRESCYLRLLHLFPVLYFDFNNSGNSDYRISDVVVTIYYQVQKLGEHNNPYINKSDLGKEALVIDHTIGTKVYGLSQIHDFANNKTFALELTLLSSDFRSDDIPRQYLVDFTFKFKSGAKDIDIKSAPFFIDM